MEISDYRRCYSHVLSSGPSSYVMLFRLDVGSGESEQDRLVKAYGKIMTKISRSRK